MSVKFLHIVSSIAHAVEKTLWSGTQETAKLTNRYPIHLYAKPGGLVVNEELESVCIALVLVLRYS
jgi:hypothetical protein